MKNRVFKKALAICLSAVMCLMPVSIPQTVQAEDTPVPEDVIEQGALWRFYETDEENVWYIQNVRDETFLASDGGAALSETEFPIKVTLQSDQTYLLDFRTTENPDITKRYFAVGSKLTYSLGEAYKRFTQLFEKQQDGSHVSFVKTASIEEGKEYMLTMASRDGSDTTAEAATQYALTNRLDSTKYIQPYVLTLSESGTSADGAVSSADKVLAKPYIVFQEPIYSKELPDAEAVFWGNSAEQVQVSTSWNPAHETVTDHVAYTVTVTAEAQGDLTFSDETVPKTVKLSDGTILRLAEGEAVLSEDRKTLTVSHTFPEITDIRIMPEYTVPTGLSAVVGQSLEDVALPEGFTYQEPSTEAWTASGYYTYEVTYTPEDTEKYFIVTDIRVTVLVVDEKENLTDNGVLWNFVKQEDDTWGLWNISEGKYLGHDETNTYISLNDTPEAVDVTLNSDGTCTLAVGEGSKQYLAVGSGNKFSMGGNVYKTQLFVRTREGNQYVYKKTALLEEGKEYVVAMAHRNDNAETAAAASLFALTGQIDPNNGDARILPYSVTIQGDNLAVVPEEIVDNSLAQPEISIPELVYGEAFPSVTVEISGAEEGAFTAAAIWQTEDTAVGANIPYQVAVTVTAAEGYKFTQDSVPAAITVGGKRTVLESGAAVLKDEKHIEVSYTFAPLDIREEPEYTVPSGLTAKKGASLKDIVLPQGFAFEEAEDTVLDTAGNITCHLTYTPEDTEKYFEVTNIPVVIRVVESYASLTEQGVIWRFEKAEGENRWNLFNVASEKYLGRDTESSTYIALNDEPETCTVTLNEDGTWLIAYSGTKAHLAVGSGNKYSMGEQSYKTVLFEKKREGDAFSLEKSTSIEDGKEYVIAMAYRNNNAGTATASLLYALTNQVDPNNGDARILSYEVNVANGKITAVSDAEDIGVFGKTEITLEKPMAGGTPADAEVSVLYGEAGEYQAVTAWTPAAEKFEQSKAYTAVVTLTAGDGFTFGDNSVPKEILLKDGTSMAVLEGKAGLSADRKVLSVTVEFASLTVVSYIELPEGVPHGSLSVPDMYAAAGDTVTVTASPEDGYELEELTVRADSENIPCTKVSETEWTFVMPESDVSLSARFVRITYAVEVSGMNHGTLADPVEKASAGDIVTLKLLPDRGYVLKSLKVKVKESGAAVATEVTEDGYTFTMPAEAVTVQAAFERLFYSAETKWCAHGKLELSQEKAGYQVNIFVTVTPDEGYVLKELNVLADGKKVEVQKVDDTFYLFSMPDGNVTVSGTFTEKTEPDKKPGDGTNVKPEEPAQPEKPEPPVSVPATVKGLKVKQSGGKLVVSFKKVKGATRYIIYRSTKKAGGYKKVAAIKAGKKLTYKDAKVKKGKTYYYKVVTQKGKQKSPMTKAVKKKVK